LPVIWEQSEPKQTPMKKIIQFLFLILLASFNNEPKYNYILINENPDTVVNKKNI